MNKIEGKKILTHIDMLNHSIWYFDESDENHYPVISFDDIPEDSYDLNIRAIFKTPGGLIFEGYIVGIQNLYVITLFYEDMILYFNKNLLDHCYKSFDQINSKLSQQIDIHDFFPLNYETTIDLPEFKNISGEFDIFKQMSNEERLAAYDID